MLCDCVRTPHVTGCRDREEDRGGVGDELRLDVLKGLEYFGTRGEKRVDLVRFGGTFNADVAVGDQSVVQCFLNLNDGGRCRRREISERIREEAKRENDGATKQYPPWLITHGFYIVFDSEHQRLLRPTKFVIWCRWVREEQAQTLLRDVVDIRNVEPRWR